MIRIASSIVAAAALLLPFAGPAKAAGESVELLSHGWSFNGMFGTYDRAALQRGFQVYQAVCAGCHGIKYIAFRNLADLGYNEDEVKAIAAQYTVEDGPDEAGDMFDRPGQPSDYIPEPFPNDAAAAASNGGKAPPDLSLLAKARADGANYIYSLMLGYEEPHDIEVPDGSYYNKYFPGHVIAMPEPIYEDAVTYEDGTAASVEQMSADVTEFLYWAAEPKLEERKATGLRVVIFLIILVGIFYAYKRKLWADVH